MKRAKLTIVDRAVAYFSPQAGLNRARARIAYAAVSGYMGARRGRRATSEWATPAGSADFETLPDLSVLRSRSRDLVRNDPIAQSAISTKVTNVIGAGHVVRPEIRADRLGLSPDQKSEWEAAAADVWQSWAENSDCDITRAQSFGELEDLVHRSRLVSGDVFVLLRYRKLPNRLLGTALHIVEADRVSNPSRKMDTAQLAGGVELDANGAPKAYHIANRHEFDLDIAQTEWNRVPAFDGSGRRLVLHVHGSRWRPDMTRYAPMLAPVIESLKQRSRYSEAELMAAVVSACFAIGLKSPDGELGGDLTAADGGDSSDIKITEPGQIFDLLPDEEIQSFEPGRPSPQFEPFINAVAQEIGAGVDLPHELLVKQFQASYSASRAALEMAWQFFRVDRAHHVTQFCRPVYERVIAEAVSTGALDAPGFFSDPLIRGAWLGAIWMGPARPTIDPTKDATADKAYLEMGTTTRTRIAAERFGVAWEEVAERKRAEDELLGAAAPAQSEPPEDDDEETPPEDEGDIDTEES